MSSSPKREPCCISPHAVGEAGRWAMDGAADRMQVLSVWRQQWNNSAQWRLSERKRGGATWDFSVKHLTATVFASVFGFTEGRQGERGLSVLMKAYLPDTEYTTYTWGWSMVMTHQRHIPSALNPGQNCRLLWVVIAMCHQNALGYRSSPDPWFDLFWFNFFQVTVSALSAMPLAPMSVF